MQKEKVMPINGYIYLCIEQREVVTKSGVFVGNEKQSAFATVVGLDNKDDGIKELGLRVGDRVIYNKFDCKMYKQENKKTYVFCSVDNIFCKI